MSPGGTFELRHLRYFLVVAELLHFRRAAEQLGVAQPALSQQIRRLESIVGVDLFERTTRSVELTPAGAAFRVHARRALDEAEAAVTAAHRAARGEIGHLTVGFIESAAAGLIPDAVRRLRTERPDVSLTLRELSVEAQLDGLEAGEIDLGIVRPPIDASELEVATVSEERLLAAVPTGHPLAGRRRVSPATLRSEPLVVLSREVVPGLYEQISALLGDGALTPAQSATSIQAVLGLVSAELGIAVLPTSVRSLARDGVVFVPISPSPLSVVQAIHRRGERAPLIDAFLDAAKRAGAGRRP